MSPINIGLLFPKTRYPLLPKETGFNQKIYPTEPVIYKIVNTDNGKVYVGQTTKFRKRLSQHYNALSKGKHCSYYLQKSFNKHGVDKYYFEILEGVTKDNICEREIHWIEKLDSSNRDRGYNILVNASSPWYGKRSVLHCKRISIALTGKHPTEETKKKQSIARKGRFLGIHNGAAKVVEQYTKDMIFKDTFTSIRKAASATGTSKYSISRNIKGEIDSVGDFIWKGKEVL